MLRGAASEAEVEKERMEAGIVDRNGGRAGGVIVRKGWVVIERREKDERRGEVEVNV